MRAVVLVLVLVLDSMGCSGTDVVDDAAAARETKRAVLARHYGELTPAERQMLLQASFRTEADGDRVVAQMKEVKTARERADRQRQERLAAGPRTPAEIRRELMRRYGPELTSLQQSYIQATDFSSLESGDALCRKWVAENRAFRRGR